MIRIHQLNHTLRSWALRRTLNRKQRQFIVAKVKERKASGKGGTVFTFGNTGVALEERQIREILRRYGNEARGRLQPRAFEPTINGNFSSGSNIDNLANTYLG